MTKTEPWSCVLAGAGHFAAAQIAAHFALHHVSVTEIPSLDRTEVSEALRGATNAAALVVVLPRPTLGKAFLEVEDADLEASMERAIDVIAAVGAGLEALPDNGTIVVVGDRGFLGGWGGAHEMALSGAVMGLVRSASLAARPRAIRVNAVALDLPGRASVDPLSAAAVTMFLASPDSKFVNGEIILANSGRSLLLREAIDRR